MRYYAASADGTTLIGPYGPLDAAAIVEILGGSAAGFHVAQVREEQA